MVLHKPFQTYFFLYWISLELATNRFYLSIHSIYLYPLEECEAFVFIYLYNEIEQY